MQPQVLFQIVSGPLSGSSFTFAAHDTFLCGRHSDCHARILKDPRVSRHHFLLEINPPDVRLRDLGSLNGTYVNGQKIGGRNAVETPQSAAARSYPEAEVRDGDQIVVGRTTINVSIADPAKTIDLPPPVAAKCEKCGRNGWRDSASDASFVCEDCRAPTLPESGGVHKLLRQAIGDAAPQQNASLLEAYSIDEQIGRGGMGAVYRATRRANGQTVAVKMMLARVAVREAARQAFLREIDVIRQLDHPHVVRLFESDSAGAAFYFAMEYCDRGSLQDLIKAHGGKLPLSVGLPLMRQALEGLAYTHRAGFVHRDLKPHNLLLTKTSNGLVVKISDFGLAKQFAQAGLSGMTATGSMGGTFHFMPREQLTDFKRAQPASDVWSLAATFYYAFTGHTALNFDASRDPIAVLLNDEPVPIRQRDPSFPSALAAIFDKALSSEVATRYPNADAMRASL
jgi:hypothetical protein